MTLPTARDVERMSAIKKGHASTRWSVAALTCGAALLALCISAPVPYVLAQQNAASPLVLVGNRDYPPLSYLDNGVARGFDVDVAHAVAAAMGREVRVELMDWAAARERVLNGSADGLLNLGVSDARRESWSFTEPTMRHDFGLFVRKNELVIRGVSDLAGKRVGVARGGFPEEYLKLQPRVVLVPIDSYDDGFSRLQRGTIDAVAADTWVGAYTIQHRGLTGIVVTGDSFATVSSGIAVRKGDVALVETINRAIRAINDNGQLTAIRERWRPQEVVFVSRRRIQQYVYLAIGGFAIVLVIGLAIWVRTLKQQVAARRSAEAALGESNEHLGLALSSAEMGTWRWTAATDTATRDRHLNQMLGLESEVRPASLADWFEHIHPDDRAMVRTQFDRAMQDHVPYSSEFRIIRPDGTVRWLRSQGRPYYDDDGRLEYMTGVALDITDRRIADEALRASEEKFAKAFVAGPDCVALSDFDTGILEVSPRFEALTGFSREEVIGRTIADLGLVPASVRDDFIRRLRRDGYVRDYEFDVRRKDGAVRTAQMSADTLEIAGRPAFISVSRDITDQRRLEANLHRVSEINKLLVAELEPELLYEAITQSLGVLLPVDYAGVVLRDEVTGELRLRAHTLYQSTGVAASEHMRAAQLGPTPAGVALERGDVVVFDRQELESFAAAAPLIAENLRTLCCAPLTGRNGPIGVLSAGSRREHAFTAEHITLAREMATFVAIAIENARNHEEVLALKNQLAEEKLYLEEEIRGDHDFGDIIGSSMALRRVMSQIRTVAPTDSTVLLLGETGTGKELLARSLHELSPRCGRTFVKVNAAALPASLLESELFGYDRGAFTGAVGSKLGRFELANRGTLFLDEVGDLPLELQPKLLRVLQEREFERLGATRVTRVDVRLIAATNRNLETMAAEGMFRSDLFYRLNVFPIVVPPLRERPEDIPLLVRHFVRRFSQKLKRHIESVPASTMQALQRWHWPGNIRELENVIERAVIISTGSVLQVAPPEMPLTTESAMPAPSVPSRSRDTRPTFADAERESILRALRDANGVIAGESGAAARLGLKRTTLHSKMRKLGIRRMPF
jgi:formate hydrogenlyase transcriptional activator